MAFGFGPGSDMMKSVESNRKQIRKKKSLKQITEAFGNESCAKPEFVKVSKEELERLKQEFLLNKRKEQQQVYVLLGFVILAVVVGFYFIMF
ncbi:hypothetical protein ABN763_09995 [Spongiivirga sp. MCCC 1A20706]|uniref:hypothetical protein n=1 Tax=Spongiivirga sp. MCCC 1A20706 TaxID=3160963 RepID=UPI0039778EF6